MLSEKPWSGNFTAVVTPFTAPGDLDEQRFRQNIELLIAEGIDGIIVAGCTGEHWALDTSERITLFRWGKEAAQGRVPVIAHITDLNHSRLRVLGEAARDLKMDGVMVSPPWMIHPAASDVFELYRWASDAFALPILAYNYPSHLGVDLTPQALLSLAEIPMVAGVKKSTENFVDLTTTINLVGDKLSILAGRTIKHAFAALSVGADGLVSADDPQLLGREAIAMLDLFRRGKTADCRAL